MYSNILVPIDGSDTANLGLGEAIKLAQDQGARLRLFHVVNELILTSYDAAFALPQVIDGLRNRPLATAARMFSGDIERRTERAAKTLPLLEADKVVAGHKVPFWRHWFGNAIGSDTFWTELDHRHRLTATTPPVHFISGWYDFMVDPLLADYQRLVALGHRPYLTIGTWFHIAEELQRDNLLETIVWMRAKLMGDESGLREKPVRLHVSGRNEWHEFDRYPPDGSKAQTWHIGTDRALTAGDAISAGSDR